MPARYLSELDVSPALLRGLPRGAPVHRSPATQDEVGSFTRPAAWRSFTRSQFQG